MLRLKKMITSAYNYLFSTGAADFKETSTTQRKPINSIEVVNEIETITTDNETLGKYDPMEIVAWFLDKESMTHLKLQKLCYYAQAWFYTLKGIRLMNTDFQAWVHGPVAPDIYDKLKCFGFSGIRLAEKYCGVIEDDDLELLESVWETYGDSTGNALEALTHTEKPWVDARLGYSPDERCSVVITLKSMAEYYSSIYTGGDA